jgi:uncharacterized protein (TIGR02588 family)
MTDVQKQQGSKQDQQQNQPAARSAAEWIVAAIGLILTVGTIGFMFYQAFMSANTPPQIYVLMNAIEEFPEGYVVTVTAKNTGAATGAAVSIEGTLKSGDQTVETSTATISYVPGHSERRAGLLFTQDPRQYTLELRAKGYEAP